MVESGRVPGEGRLRATFEKLPGRVSEKDRISVSTRNLENPGEHQEKVESVPLLKNCTDEFRKRVESMRVPENGKFRPIYYEKVESVPLLKHCTDDFRKR